MEDVLTVFKASQYCNVSPKTIINWVESGHIKAYKTVGGHRRINKSDLEVFMHKQGIPIPGEQPVEGKKKILVVDNEEDQLDMMGSLLDRMGYQVVLAQDPDTALNLVKKGRFSLVITDMIMPGKDGMELCEQIKAVWPKTTVYMFSGHAELYEPEKIKRAGFDGYLQKPIDVAQLRREIEKVFVANGKRDIS